MSSNRKQTQTQQILAITLRFENDSHQRPHSVRITVKFEYEANKGRLAPESQQQRVIITLCVISRLKNNKQILENQNQT